MLGVSLVLWFARASVEGVLPGWSKHEWYVHGYSVSGLIPPSLTLVFMVYVRERCGWASRQWIGNRQTEQWQTDPVWVQTRLYAVVDRRKVLGARPGHPQRARRLSTQKFRPRTFRGGTGWLVHSRQTTQQDVWSEVSEAGTRWASIRVRLPLIHPWIQRPIWWVCVCGVYRNQTHGQMVSISSETVIAIFYRYPMNHSSWTCLKFRNC